MKTGMVSADTCFVKEYIYDHPVKFITDYRSSAWETPGLKPLKKVARLGYWEFEDYKPLLMFAERVRNATLAAASGTLRRHS